jgi:S-adenosylmethionine hydrolase
VTPVVYPYPMIVLFTDFGLEGPYVGQMKAVLYREAPGVPVVDLFADVPAFDAQGAAYLLAAYAVEFPAGTIFLCVVDPGVGSARRAAVVKGDGRWYVGPDNGLLSIAAKRASEAAWWDVEWRPPRLSASFHGRDLFAPVAARIARGDPVPGQPVSPEDRLAPDWPDDLPRIVYIDHYGNAMTGLRAIALPAGTRLEVRGHSVARARTFSDVPPGEAFWYENANGLVEIAVNQGRADQALGLEVGLPVSI